MRHLKLMPVAVLAAFSLFVLCGCNNAPEEAEGTPGATTAGSAAPAAAGPSGNMGAAPRAPQLEK